MMTAEHGDGAQPVEARELPVLGGQGSGQRGRHLRQLLDDGRRDGFVTPGVQGADQLDEPDRGGDDEHGLGRRRGARVWPNVIATAKATVATVAITGAIGILRRRMAQRPRERSRRGARSTCRGRYCENEQLGRVSIWSFFSWVNAWKNPNVRATRAITHGGEAGLCDIMYFHADPPVDRLLGRHVARGRGGDRRMHGRDQYPV